MIAER